MDPIGWYIFTLHQMIGHDKTAAIIGMPPGPKEHCVMCQYNQNPDETTRQRVVLALAPQYDRSGMS
jgi:hypothetical protein